MAQIICRDLAIGYEGKTAVQNINLSVKKGDYLCVIGENGAGKSTFMKTLLGLLPPVSGKIEFYDGLKKNEIGYLPQQTEVQKDFPGIRERNCSLRMSESPWLLAVLPYKRKKLRRRYDEKTADHSSVKTLLQRIVRRAAAESSACKSTLCDQENPASG